MRKIILMASICWACVPVTTHAEEFLSADARIAVFCGKTFDGKNEISGWTFRIHSHPSCDRITIRYLTGDQAGQTFERKVTHYPSGENCVKLENGKETCTKVKDVGNGTYHLYATNGKFNGKHFNTLTNIVDGNQL